MIGSKRRVYGERKREPIMVAVMKVGIGAVSSRRAESVTRSRGYQWT